MLISFLIFVSSFLFLNFLLVLKITRATIVLKVDNTYAEVNNFKNIIVFVFSFNIKAVTFLLIYSFFKNIKIKVKINFFKFIYKFLFNKVTGKSK
jgi:hypothetical protein